MKRYLICLYCAVLAFSLTACYRPEDVAVGEEISFAAEQQASETQPEAADAQTPESEAAVSPEQPDDTAPAGSTTAAGENGQNPAGQPTDEQLSDEKVTTTRPTEAPSTGQTAKPTTRPTTESTTRPTTGTTTQPTTKPSTAPTPVPGSKVEQVAALVNEERAKAGLSLLTLDPELSANAMVRAQEIIEKFDHTRPDGSSFSTAITIPWRTVGENIAYGQSSPEAVMNAWMNSSGHRANILQANFSKIGVGVVESGGRLYWVQLFAG